jgi:hypothetical protein
MRKLFARRRNRLLWRLDQPCRIERLVEARKSDIAARPATLRPAIYRVIGERYEYPTGTLAMRTLGHSRNERQSH